MSDYPDFNQYSSGSGETGNPLLDRLFTLLNNFNSSPQVGNQQSIYDAYLERERSRQFMFTVQRNAAINNQLTDFFGVNPQSPIVRSAGLLLGDPNGVYANALKNITGSNPILAQSLLYGGLTGSTTGAFTNQFGNIGPSAVGQLGTALNQAFYSQRAISDSYLNDEVKRQAQKAQEAITNNPALAQLYGIKNGKFDAGTAYSLGVNGEVMSQLQDSINQQQQATKDSDRKIIAAQEAQNLKNANVPANWISDNTDKNGNVNLSAIQNLLLNNDVSNAIKSIGGYKKMYGHMTAGAENYETTRGFSQEDISSAFISAADLQMVGRQGMYEAGSGFFKNSEGALSAARSVFGNKPGGELMKDISSLLGTDSYDMTNPQDAKKVEDLLRNMKATARVAGQSIDSIVGIIKTAQQVASEHPELQYLGGGGITNIVLDATKNAVMLNHMLSPEDSRAMGGVQGIQTSLVGNGLKGQGSLISRLVASATYLYGDNKGVQDAIANYNADPNNGGLNGLLTNIGAATGYSGQVMGSLLGNADVNMMAMKNKTAAAAGLDAYNKALLPDLFNQISMGGPGQLDKFQKLISSPGGVSKDDIFKFFMANGGRDTQAAHTFASNIPAYMASIEAFRPDGAAYSAAQNAQISQSALEDTQFDVSHANRYGTAYHRDIQDFIGKKDTDIPRLLTSLRDSIFDPTVANSRTPEENQRLETQVSAAEKFFNSSGDKLGAAADLFSTISGKPIKEDFMGKVYTNILGTTSDKDAQAFIDQYISNPDDQQMIAKNGAIGFGQAVYSAIGQGERNKSYQLWLDKKEQTMSDIISKMNNSVSGKVLSSYKGHYEDLLSADDDSLKKLGIDPDSGDLKSIKDSIDAEGDDANRIKAERDNVGGNIEQENPMKDLMSVINDLIKAISSPNVISNAVSSLTDTLAKF